MIIWVQGATVDGFSIVIEPNNKYFDVTNLKPNKSLGTRMYSFAVYELDENGGELDPVKYFSSNRLEDAKAWAKKQSFATDIVCIPKTDPDDDPNVEEWFKYNSPYDPYELVWSSNDENEEEKKDESLSLHEALNLLLKK